MRPTYLPQLLCLLTSITLAAAQDSPAFYLRNSDRVVFYGDSITDQRLYTVFTETYVVTRFPHLRVSFVHSGWGGDRVSGGGGGPIDLRLRRDVIAYDPTVMTIMLGMNDGSYRAFDPGIFDQYARGYEHILAVLKRALPDLRLTLIQPSPFDDVTRPPKFEGGYNQVLERYSQFVQELAQSNHLAVADLNTPVVAALEKAKAANADLAQRILPDRVHPGPGGHLLMAEALLKAWHAPALVASVEIDAAGNRVVGTGNARVTRLQSAAGVTWTERDDCLPMPVDMNDPVVALAINSSDFVSALDQEPLKVTGLTAARYTLKIDGVEAGTFTREELAAGINLALLPTPMAKQAAEVQRLTVEHNNIHFTRWRQVQVPLARELAKDQSPRVQRAVRELMGALDADESAVVRQQHAAAQPVPHQFDLSPQ
ncbi:MAG: SGNH/GDSL hydrolase family protein [Verrucomicrobia bacterium]|nr:SGNH/GDSL hydrolase family protein [Verrucomicrobiota bacterium]